MALWFRVICDDLSENYTSGCLHFYQGGFSWRIFGWLLCCWVSFSHTSCFCAPPEFIWVTGFTILIREELLTFNSDDLSWDSCWHCVNGLWSPAGQTTWAAWTIITVVDLCWFHKMSAPSAPGQTFFCFCVCQAGQDFYVMFTESSPHLAASPVMFSYSEKCLATLIGG